MEAVHWSEVGPAAAPDPAIMAFATPKRFVILTKLSGILQIA
jgi:predicted nuclease of predicted toxin-antitoxin system